SQGGRALIRHHLVGEGELEITGEGDGAGDGCPWPGVAGGGWWAVEPATWPNCGRSGWVGGAGLAVAKSTTNPTAAKPTTAPALASASWPGAPGGRSPVFCDERR